MGKVTIEDVSRQTGLSRGTVSRALNDRPDISEETKRRVLAACRQLHYVRSYAARSLATGRRYAVAVLVDDLRSTFEVCFLRGVIARARADRYAVHVSDLGSQEESVLDHVRTLAGERVDAMLLASPPGTEVARQIAEAMGDRPLVAAAPVRGINCDVLAPDYAEAGRLAARYVLKDLAPNVLYVHQSGSRAAEERRAGFHEVCRAAGLDPQRITIDVGPGPAGDGERLRSVLSRLADIRAIAASDDFLALELVLLCARAGRVPGHDIAILGQGNELAGERSWPTLSTIDFCGDEIGHRAMDLALQRVTRARQDAPQQTYVPPVLIARETTRLLQ
jgi:LacI family transcriptional regulator